ncbi:ADP-ribosylglycohydrolase family protein, partial [Streptomyces vinaceus]|uniref:ADP-ribosylglycohydrolase family protein n=1 Tax=Streptomyces vinaceus TaxID=1960 RepID=UPI003687FB37
PVAATPPGPISPPRGGGAPHSPPRGATPPRPPAPGGAWEGTAVLHELVRVTLDGGDPLAALPGVLDAVHPDHRERYGVVLGPDWHPGLATEFNGAVWPCLGSAVWALRTTTGFAAAVRAAVDLGGDTDTVAAVTGTLAGARYGQASIPPEWTAPLHVPLPGFGDRVLDADGLRALARSLAAGRPS